MLLSNLLFLLYLGPQVQNPLDTVCMRSWSLKLTAWFLSPSVVLNVVNPRYRVASSGKIEAKSGKNSLSKQRAS